jgi:cell division protein FtsB
MLFIRARTHSTHSSLPGVARSNGLLLPVCMRVQDSDKKTAMKIYAVLLIILLIFLQFKFWFEDGGYFHNMGLEKELDALRAENEQLRARNQELARQIILVKENMDEIESLARRNLGMIRDGEQFIFIIDDEKSGEPDSAAEQQPEQVKHD